MKTGKLNLLETLDGNFSPDGHQARDLHLLIGSGGSRAILAGTGVILALTSCQFAGWRSIGGVSGGSMPTLLLAAGVSPPELLRVVLETDFNSLVRRRGSILAFIKSLLKQYSDTGEVPEVGALDSTDLGAFIDGLVPEWPEAFWTMALSDFKPVVFTRNGIFLVEDNASPVALAPHPGSLGFAIRATCAVPGVLDAMPYVDNQQVRHLLTDGGLGPEKRCPASLIEKLFDTQSSLTVVVNVGEDVSAIRKAADKFHRRVFGRPFLPSSNEPEPENTPNRLAILPDTTNVGSFKFRLTKKEKWETILRGYREAVTVLHKHGLLSEENLPLCQSRIREAELLLKHPQWKSGNHHSLAQELEGLFAGCHFSLRLHENAPE